MAASERRTIVVVGAGAIGLTLAALLAEQHEVWLVTRTSRPDREIVLDGARTRRVLLPDARVVAWSARRTLPSDALYFLTVKAYDLEQVLDGLAVQLSGAARVVGCQNGLGIYETLTRRLGERSLRMLVQIGARRLERFRVQVAGLGESEVGGQDQEEAARVAALLSHAGIPSVVASEVRQAEWRKALLNLMVNPITALLRRENGALIEVPELRAAAQAVSAEVRAVASAHGVDLRLPSDVQIFETVARYRENRNSLLVDIERGTRSEAPFYLDRCVALAREAGVAVPNLELLTKLVNAATRTGE